MPQFIMPMGTAEALDTFHSLDPFTQAYIEAMYFTETGYMENGDLEDASLEDLAPEALEQCKADCAKFQADNATALQVGTDTQAGHDFWLTRNRHGAGFWDGDWPEPEATQLTEAAHSFGEVWPYRGDDKRMYIS